MLTVKVWKRYTYHHVPQSLKQNHLDLEASKRKSIKRRSTKDCCDTQHCWPHSLTMWANGTQAFLLVFTSPELFRCFKMAPYWLYFQVLNFAVSFDSGVECFWQLKLFLAVGLIFQGILRIHEPFICAFFGFWACGRHTSSATFRRPFRWRLPRRGISAETLRRGETLGAGGRDVHGRHVLHSWWFFIGFHLTIIGKFWFFDIYQKYI